MDLGLHDTVVFVVGGTGLIGSAIAAGARAEGARVLTGARSGADIEIDIRDQESVARAFATVLERAGTVDAVVVTAAPSARTLDRERRNDPAQVMEAFDAKALGFLRVANEAIRIMQKQGGGRIVGVSGQNAFITGHLTASVRNAAVILAAKNLADELAGTGIVINTVSPGGVDPDARSEVEQGAAGQSTPRQVADAVIFLLSPHSAISGESIAVGHRVRGMGAL